MPLADLSRALAEQQLSTIEPALSRVDALVSRPVVVPEDAWRGAGATALAAAELDLAARIREARDLLGQARASLRAALATPDG